MNTVIAVGCVPDGELLASVHRTRHLVVDLALELDCQHAGIPLRRRAPHEAHPVRHVRIRPIQVVRDASALEDLHTTQRDNTQAFVR